MLCLKEIQIFNIYYIWKAVFCWQCVYLIALSCLWPKAFPLKLITRVEINQKLFKLFSQAYLFCMFSALRSFLSVFFFFLLQLPSTNVCWGFNSSKCHVTYPEEQTQIVLRSGTAEQVASPINRSIANFFFCYCCCCLFSCLSRSEKRIEGLRESLAGIARHVYPLACKIELSMNIGKNLNVR